MSMSYRQTDSDPDDLRPYLISGFLFAILLHIGIFLWIKNEQLETFGAPYYDKIIPRVFQVEPVEIDPRVFDKEEAIVEEAPAKPVPDETKIEIPEEKPSFALLAKELVATPSAPEESNMLSETKPRVRPSDLTMVAEELRQDQQRSLDMDLNALAQQLIRDRPEVNSRPLVEIPGFDPSRKENIALATNARTEMRGENQGPATAVPGFSDLDGLLSQAGPMRNSAAPIMMPADFLFSYNEFQLRSTAVPSLTKLGTIIRRNPGAVVIIEGHTDSFGPDDYNAQLSRMRAESVKNWLVFNMGIEPRQIETRGLGKSKLLAPASGDVDEQQINRRVEVTIRNPRVQ